MEGGWRLFDLNVAADFRIWADESGFKNFKMPEVVGRREPTVLHNKAAVLKKLRKEAGRSKRANAIKGVIPECPAISTAARERMLMELLVHEGSASESDGVDLHSEGVKCGRMHRAKAD